MSGSALAYGHGEILRLVGRDQAGGQRLHDDHLAGHAARLHATDEPFDDGLDHPGAHRPAGVFIDFDFHRLPGRRLTAAGNDAVAEARGYDDRRGRLVRIHLAASPGRVRHERGQQQPGQIFRSEQVCQGLAQLAVVLVDDQHRDGRQPAGAAATHLAGDEAQADGQQKGREEHKGERGAVAEDQFDIFETDEDELFHDLAPWSIAQAAAG